MATWAARVVFTMELEMTFEVAAEHNLGAIEAASREARRELPTPPSGLTWVMTEMHLNRQDEEGPEYHMQAIRKLP